MLSFNSLTLKIGARELYKNISMSFLPSSIIYIKGGNGSGKTSLLRTIASIQEPTKGSISFSKNSYNLLELVKPYCTYIGHDSGIKTELTVLENLEFWANCYDSKELIQAAIIYFSLQNIINTKCCKLSAGNQKKVALARLFVCKSKLWLLDEADSNLDIQNKNLLDNLIIAHANNGGIAFITTHGGFKIKTAQILDISDYKGE